MAQAVSTRRHRHARQRQVAEPVVSRNERESALAVRRLLRQFVIPFIKIVICLTRFVFARVDDFRLLAFAQLHRFQAFADTGFCSTLS
jgi:hypothetical protein